jgi:hypothetical protein
MDGLHSPVFAIAVVVVIVHLPFALEPSSSKSSCLTTEEMTTEVVEVAGDTAGTFSEGIC